MSIDKEDFYRRYEQDVHLMFPEKVGSHVDRDACFNLDEFNIITHGLSFDAVLNSPYESVDKSSLGFFSNFKVDSLYLRDPKKSICVSKDVYDSFYNRHGGFYMTEITDDGFYEFSFGPHVSNGDSMVLSSCLLRYYSNSRLKNFSEKYGLSLDDVKKRMLVGVGYGEGDNIIKFDYADLREQDLPMFFNIVYRNGLAQLYEKGTLEISDEERMSFESNSDYVVSSAEPLSDEEYFDKFLLINKLEEMTSLAEYRAHSSERLEKQSAVRRQISLENEKKEDWFNNPNNPSNLHAENINTMLEEADKHVALLDVVEENGLQDFIGEEKMAELEKSREFALMMRESSHSNGEEYGMSSGVREWYQEHYSNLENGSKSK